ncbi:MAG: hypothetical protein IKV82_05140 [Akkermansia sp.]|nr:hypothetical protein [Akkermansia sp.]
MIVDVYDLNATLCCSRYKIDVEHCGFSLIKRKRISDVLIWPDVSKNRNQPPYIQERKQPIIRDLLGKDGTFSFENCSFLADFWQMEHQDEKKIEAFFRSLRHSSYAFDNQADWNVILIPDNFDANLQEKILRTCSLPRESTFLLWRSVATCLGNLSLLKQLPDKSLVVKVIDYQLRYCDESVLNLIYEDNLIVPQRRAYKMGEFYPRHDKYDGQDVFEPSNDFYRHTYYGTTKDCVVWDAQQGQFARKHFVKERKIRLFIEGGGSKLQVHRFSASDGAAIFVARKASGRATYYDESTGLYIVVQDLEKEEIYAKELIAPNSKCPGGEVILGQVNTDCFIDKGTDNVRFRLADSHGDDVPLKVLDYTFMTGAMKTREPLKLHPSMIPGQGIARVRVTGEHQLRTSVDLDLLEMELTNPVETVNSLRKDIKHSYPVDIPAVAADSWLWQEVESKVKRYMNNRRYRDKTMFSKCRYADAKATGMDRLNRINVFGYALNRELPLYSGGFDFGGLFQYMENDYRYCQKRDDMDGMYTVLAMISRTYQGNNPVFDPIKRELLKQVEICSREESGSISTHVMTACANLLRSSDELNQFFQAFLRKAGAVTEDVSLEGLIYGLRSRKLLGASIFVPEFKGLLHWNRVLAELLIANNEMLSRISSADCNKCMRYLLTMLASYHYHGKPRLTYGVLKVCLFLLMRRKYDKLFLSPGSEIREQAEEVLAETKQSTDKLVGTWSDIVMKYVQGKGTLDDLIIAVEPDQES